MVFFCFPHKFKLVDRDYFPHFPINMANSICAHSRPFIVLLAWLISQSHSRKDLILLRRPSTNASWSQNVLNDGASFKNTTEIICKMMYFKKNEGILLYINTSGLFLGLRLSCLSYSSMWAFKNQRKLGAVWFFKKDIYVHLKKSVVDPQCYFVLFSNVQHSG